MQTIKIIFSLLMVILFNATISRAQAPQAANRPKADDIYTVVEVMPKPECGWTVYQEYLRTSLRYPASALKEQKQGQVLVQFLIDTDGNLSDFRILKGMGYGCDEEAIRLIKEGAKWTVGKLKGEPVKVRYLMKIPFEQTRH